MTPEERKAIRTDLIGRGFTRTGYTDDIDGTGKYAETYRHPDGTEITVSWAPKTDTLGSPEPVQDAPGMYDEPDAGLAFALPLAAEEDRIPGGPTSR